MKVWRAGRLPPPRVTTRDLGVDTQCVAQSSPTCDALHSCQTPPKEALRALQKLSSVRLAPRFRLSCVLARAFNSFVGG
eukprot:3083548-Amphidinium_carterae.1